MVQHSNTASSNVINCFVLYFDLFITYLHRLFYRFDEVRCNTLHWVCEKLFDIYTIITINGSAIWKVAQILNVNFVKNKKPKTKYKTNGICLQLYQTAL